MKTIPILLLSTLVCVSAVAQDTKPATAAAVALTAAPTTAPTAAPIVVPKHACKAPDAPGHLASANQQKNFSRDVDLYKNCLIQYREERSKIAKANAEAGNAAVEEFNAFVAAIKK